MTAPTVKGSVALIPYWLTIHPKNLDQSDHFWWFAPLCGFETLIYAGPSVANECWSSMGLRISSIRTSSKCWSVTEIAYPLKSMLGLDVKDISLLWHVIEASGTCWVTEISLIRGSAIAVIADTHHLRNPISSLVQYITTAGYTHITCTHNQHTPFFEVASGLPSFSFPFSSLGASMTHQRSSSEQPLVYFGNLISRHHIFRTRFVNHLLTRTCLRIGGRLSFSSWIDLLSSSSFSVFTCSLNGSFSFQTLYPLLTGNVLITDPIAPSNWLGQLLPYLENCYIYTDQSTCLDISSALEISASSLDSSPPYRSHFSGSSILFELLNTEYNMSLAFAGKELALEHIRDLSTLPQRQLSLLLSKAKMELGLSEVLRMVRLYESIQEFHQFNWAPAIANIEIKSIKDDIYNSFLHLLPSVLPRLRYGKFSSCSHNALMRVSDQLPNNHIY
jgi:hypothetical protein